jgi:hypothetical protein
MDNGEIPLGDLRCGSAWCCHLSSTSAQDHFSVRPQNSAQHQHRHPHIIPSNDENLIDHRLLLDLMLTEIEGTIDRDP